MAEATLARRRARSGRVRSLAHLVPIAPDDGRPAWQRLARAALCGFTAKRSWAADEAPAWEDTCPRCEARQESR